MKKINKLLFLLILVATTLLLTSCGKKADKTFQYLIYDVNPENLVVENFDEERNIDSLYFYQVLAEGQVDYLEHNRATTIVFYNNSDVVLEGDFDINDAVKKVYNFSFFNDEVKIEVVQYLKGSNVEPYVYIDYVEQKGEKPKDLSRNGAVLRDSYIFEGKNLLFYEIGSNGVKLLDSNEITYLGFPEGDDLIVNKKYINNVTFDITGETNETSATINFKIRLRADATPISHKTATFWNWLFLKMPMAYVMAFIGGIFKNSFAVAILITTIIVRTLAWPIYAKTNDMSLKMTLAQPELDKLQEKYATKKDQESQQKMQMEMMQIYKKHNINFLGCLLPFLQMPIFIAMYQVVREITIPGGQFYENVKNTKFFLTDLASGGQVAKFVFTALVGITMFALQKVSQIKPSYAKNAPTKSNPQAEQQQQTMKMVSFMMIFMMIMTAFITPGLALSYYWIIGNLFSLGQTLLNRRINEKKYLRLEEEKLYGKSREIVEAQAREKKGVDNDA